MTMRGPWRWLAALALFALLAGCASLHEIAPASGWRHYQIGDVTAPTPGKVEPGTLLVGGGDWPPEAFRWLAARGGNGHLLILRASYGDENQKEWFNDIGGLTSARTVVFYDRKAASDPTVIELVRGADMIFFGGGDQSRYVRFWRDTPLLEALNAHIAAGKPVGGTSAGLAILGEFLYSAADGGSMTTPRAIADPFNSGMTLETDFLKIPTLAGVLTDSHFAERDRQGRLLAMLDNLRGRGHAGVVGLGVDEDTALLMDAAGRARLVSLTGGEAWLLLPDVPAERAHPGQPLRHENVRAVGIGAGSELDLPGRRVVRPAFERRIGIADGEIRIEPQP